MDALIEMIPGAQLRLSSGDNEAKIAGLNSLTKGLQGLKCGISSPDRIAAFYEQEFKKLGGQIRFRTRAESIILEPTQKIGIPGEPFLWQDKKIAGVRTQAGDLRADTTILAAGCWATDILNTIGVDSRVRPKKRSLYVVTSPEIQKLLRTKGFNRHDLLPMTILPNGVLMRPAPSEGSFWAGGADDLGRPFKFEEDPQAEPNYYYQNIYPVISKYFPQYRDLRPTNMWAGLYDINTLDANPWIFENNRMIVASGLSGSGIMKADAVGRIVTALYEGKEHASLYGGRTIKVARLGLQDRDVGTERFVL
jgi:glycine/D-amino acid oxidase-like deaminating enzyme